MEMDKDLRKILVPYIFNERQMKLFAHDIEISNKLLDILTTSKFLDRPDFYNIDKEKNTVYMFEHFEVDASLNEGRGSNAIREEKKADKAILVKQMEELKNLTLNPNEPQVCKPVACAINTKNSLANLKNNFNRIFDKHYKNIPDYHKHIEDETQFINMNFVNVFVIEHKTALGGSFYNDAKKPFLFYYTDFVIDKIKQSPLIDYYIFLDYYTKSVCVVSKNEIKSLENVRIDTDKEKIVFFDDQFMISFFAFIPNSMLNKNTTK